MKTRKFYVGLSFLTLVGMFFVACEKENPVEVQGPEANTRTGEYRVTPEELTFVGEDHNAQLDALYDAYVADGIEEAESKQYAYDFLIDGIAADATMDPELAEIATNNVDYFFDNPMPATYSNFYSGLEGELTASEMAYLDDLYTIVSTDEITVEDLNTQVGVLEATISADMTLTNNNLCVLFSATQMAKRSFEYWTNEIDKWGTLGGGEPVAFGSVAGDIAKADISGAVYGAIYAFGYNIIVGPGQVAYGVAIIGGAVGNSLKKGVEKAVGWLFDKLGAILR